MKSKSARNDYSQRVDHEHPETTVDFLNSCLKESGIENCGEVQKAVLQSENIMPIIQDIRKIEDQNEKIVKLVDTLVETLQ